MSQSAEASEFIQTPEQTIGPFYGYSLPYEGGSQLVDRNTPGALRLHGTVFDGAGEGIPDAVVEIWQADENGAISQEPGSINRDGYTFTGFGRTPTDATGMLPVHHRGAGLESTAVCRSSPSWSSRAG